MTIRDEIKSYKKDRILEKAEQLFYERGFRGTSLDVIAGALEMTKPFVYGAYDRKTDILYAIALRVVQRSLDAINEACASPGTPSDKLRQLALRLFDVTIRNQAAVAVFFREENAMPAHQLEVINSLKGEIDDAISALLAEGVAAGDFRIDDIRTATLAIGGMISWTYVWYRPTGRLDAAVLGEHMAEYALRIAGARSPA